MVLAEFSSLTRSIPVSHLYAETVTEWPTVRDKIELSDTRRTRSLGQLSLGLRVSEIQNLRKIISKSLTDADSADYVFIITLSHRHFATMIDL